MLYLLACAQAEGFLASAFLLPWIPTQILLFFLITFRGGSHYEHLVFLIAGLDATLGLWILYSLFIDSWQQWLLLWKLQIMLGKTTRVFWFWQVQFFQLYTETQFLLRDFYWPVFDKGEYGEEF